jgi:uncharacterized protein (TIRG00374 family)
MKAMLPFSGSANHPLVRHRDGAGTTTSAAAAHHWQLVVGVVLTLCLLVLAYIKRGAVLETLHLLGGARPSGLLLAFALAQASFALAALGYQRVLWALDYQLSGRYVWASRLVATVLSQAIPAGAVASVAFLTQALRRRHVCAGHATLLVSLDWLSLATAKLLLMVFGVCYLTAYAGSDAAGAATIVAGVIGTALIAGAAGLLVCDEHTLCHWLLAVKRQAERLLRRRWSDAPIRRLVAEVAQGRALMIARRRELVWLLATQLGGLVGQSLAFWGILASLGGSLPVVTVIAAFGIAMIVSAFNVLPGGGTLEAVLVLILHSLSGGTQILAAAILFRLCTFWLLIPIAAVCYRRLTRERLLAGRGAQA